ncbi:MAG: hypothetical protein QOH36_1853 [Actinomycetota bacterium]|jgi:hypothetical protein|nr:hypothetical protein [Actinomycetota bacterium]MEA2971658.1 hypothetical protein [Actinomycetota bacterium]
MAHELTHSEAGELLGVYALDALDSDERVAVEHHLAGCGLCRAEVAEHIEVAGLLSSGVAGAPMAVWDRIATELVDPPPPLDLATVRALRPRSPSRSVGSPTPGRGERPRAGAGSSRGRGVRIGALVAAASVAASVIGVLGVRVVEDGRRIDQIASGAHGDKLDRVIDAAIADPEAVKVEMRSPDGALFVDAWILPDGRGYLARDNLPILSPDRNYQMWAVVGENKISVGLLGSEPEPAAFVASGAITALAITEEDAGGVVLSLQQPVVAGAVQRA